MLPCHPRELHTEEKHTYRHNAYDQMPGYDDGTVDKLSLPIRIPSQFGCLPTKYATSQKGDKGGQAGHECLPFDADTRYNQLNPDVPFLPQEPGCP